MWIDGSDVRSHPAPPVADSWLLVLHAGAYPVMVTLPGPQFGERYELVLDTGFPDGEPGRIRSRRPGTRMTVHGRTVLLFRAMRRINPYSSGHP
jgi:glycogen operon protein